MHVCRKVYQYVLTECGSTAIMQGIIGTVVAFGRVDTLQTTDNRQTRYYYTTAFRVGFQTTGPDTVPVASALV